LTLKIPKSREFLMMRLPKLRVSRTLLLLALSGPLSALAATDPLSGGDPAAGAAKAATCVACHGPAGNSANPEWPKLAGQSPKYIVEQLKYFKDGMRKNALMAPMAANLSEQDMRDLAAYYGAQKASPGVASPESVAVAQKLYRAGDAERGIPACAACHGPTGAGNAAAGYPRIGGQHSVYTALTLRRYPSLLSEPLPEGNAKTMATIASKLTDAEIAALASYANGLQ
jgi:cytochrome c553